MLGGNPASLPAWREIAAASGRDAHSAAPSFGSLTIHRGADFPQSLSEGNIPSPTLRDRLATDRVTEALLRSAQSGRWEKIASAEGTAA